MTTFVKRRRGQPAEDSESTTVTGIRRDPEGRSGQPEEQPSQSGRAGEPADHPPRPIPDTIGGYRIIGVLGEGGMGVVYEAEQQNPRRRVALKVVRGGHVVDELHARMFRRETESLGRLKHPNIAAIYESGHTTDGHDFFAMELARGQTLDEWVESRSGNPMTSNEIALRLNLFQTICDAVHYAHQRGVVHRDLKPSNVVVVSEGERSLLTSPAGDAPTVKILDFGLAKITDAKGPVASVATEIGMILGSLPYMAPEQALGEVHVIDVRTDVYALGVILFELLSGKRPYDTSGLGLIEAVHVICEDAPRSLREVWSGVRRVDADLETIVGKAIEKDPDRRYASAASFSEDVQRYLTDQPIAARPPSTAYRMRKFLQRHRLGVAIAASLALLVSGLAVWMSVMYARSVTLREAVQRSHHEAELQRDKARRSQYYAEMTLASQALALGGSVSRTHELITYWLPATSDADPRGWEWYYLDSLCHLDLRTFPTGSGNVRSVSWNPVGTTLAAPGDGGRVLVWDAPTGRVTAALDGQGGEVSAVAWRPDGARLAAAGDDGSITLWDPHVGRAELTLHGHTGPVLALSFDPGGRRLASASTDGSTRIWDVPTGVELRRLPTTTVWISLAVSWNGNGTGLATVDRAQNVAVWDPESGTKLVTLQNTCQATGLAWSPDSTRLAASCYEQQVEVWDVPGRRRLRELKGHTDLVRGLAWSGDGARLATAGWDHTVRVWDVATGRALAVLSGHVGRVDSVDWNPENTELASSGEDGTVKIWQADGARGSTMLGRHASYVVEVSWSQDGARVASVDDVGTVVFWDAAARREVFRLAGDARWLAWSADGARVAVSTASRTIEIRRAVDGELLTTLPGHDSLVVAWSPDGTRLASGGTDGAVEIWETATGKRLSALVAHNERVNSVAWSPDGRRLASASSDDSIKVWDVAAGVPRITLYHEDNVETVAWSHDGTRLASGSNDRTARIWDPTSGDLLAILGGHSNGVGSVSWNPDGTRLASASVDRTVKLWDTLTGRETLTLGPYSDWATTVAWSPDGLRLASGCRDRTVRIYDASVAYEFTEPHI